MKEWITNTHEWIVYKKLWEFVFYLTSYCCWGYCSSCLARLSFKERIWGHTHPESLCIYSCSREKCLWWYMLRSCTTSKQQERPDLTLSCSIGICLLHKMAEAIAKPNCWVEVHGRWGWHLLFPQNMLENSMWTGIQFHSRHLFFSYNYHIILKFAQYLFLWGGFKSRALQLEIIK